MQTVCWSLGIQSLSRLAGTYSSEQTLLSLGTDCRHADSHSSSQCGCGNGTLKGFLKAGTMSHINHTQAGIAIKNTFRVCHKSSNDWINVGYQLGSIHVQDDDCLDAFTVMVKDFTVVRVWIVASENTTFRAVVLKKS